MAVTTTREEKCEPVVRVEEEVEEEDREEGGRGHAMPRAMVRAKEEPPIVGSEVVTETVPEDKKGEETKETTENSSSQEAIPTLAIPPTIVAHADPILPALSTDTTSLANPPEEAGRDEERQE